MLSYTGPVLNNEVISLSKFVSQIWSLNKGTNSIAEVLGLLVT